MDASSDVWDKVGSSRDQDSRLYFCQTLIKTSSIIFIYMECIKCNQQHDGSFGSGKYCSRKCANSRIFSDDSKLKKSLANKGKSPSNKGKKIAWCSTTCLHCGFDINHRKSVKRKYHIECWRKVSGGYRKGSGVGKSGWYKGIWCDSSYELAWVIYQIEHKIHFERNYESFEYKWNNKKHKYTPDFKQNNFFIEIKGFVNEQTKEKLKVIPNLKIIFRADLNKEFDYVEKKYGKNFIMLYEGNPYEELTNNCKQCNKPCAKKNIYCSRKCSGLGNNKNKKK